MNFTTTLPTESGLFVYRTKRSPKLELAYLHLIRGVCYFGNSTEKSHIGKSVFIDNAFEWCRFVPAEEVEKAYKEGAHHSMLLQAEIDYEWNHSRAKRVMEGEL